MMPPSSEAQRRPSPWKATLFTIGFLAMVGLGTFWLMKQRGQACTPQSVALATTAVLVALVPPLWFERSMNLKAVGPLATVMWRLGILLPVIAYTTRQTEPVRNCMQGTLLACYLMTLPLESWLLIRQSNASRKLDQPDSPTPDQDAP